jgi:hypothetical protein
VDDQDVRLAEPFIGFGGVQPAGQEIAETNRAD